MQIFTKHFYERNTVTVARDLLGTILVRTIGDIQLAGMIVETEAYCFDDDPASHAYCGVTQRNKPMFGPVGHAYVYFIYGTHYCFNLVAKQKHQKAGAVLIRGVQPVEGIEYMVNNRGIKSYNNVSNGPGKLAQAFMINKDINGLDCTNSGSLHVREYKIVNHAMIKQTERIGISKGKEKLWRFVLEPKE